MNETMSLWKKVYGVIWGSPARTLDHIAQKPDFVGAGGLILAANLALTAVLVPKIREFTAWTMQNLPPGVKLSALQMDIAVNAAVVSALAAAVIIPPVLWLVMAGLLKLFNAFTGEKAGFKPLFAVTVFAYLPVLLGSIVKTAIILATPARSMARVTISPALFMPAPDLVPGKAYILLSHMDPFVVWSLVLTALGGSLAMKIPFWRTFIYLAALWVLYIVGMTFISGIGRVAA
ncbi:MAG: YIP1 family protein [Bacillota bacterium]